MKGRIRIKNIRIPNTGIKLTTMDLYNKQSLAKIPKLVMRNHISSTKPQDFTNKFKKNYQRKKLLSQWFLAELSLAILL